MAMNYLLCHVYCDSVLYYRVLPITGAFRTIYMITGDLAKSILRQSSL